MMKKIINSMLTRGGAYNTYININKVNKDETTIGAFVTTVIWVIFTAIFGYYIKFFARYDLIYGSLSSITILLIWLYVLSFILILGIVINTTKYNK